eukprot:3748130-Prymnesium_polylepis.1
MRRTTSCVCARVRSAMRRWRLAVRLVHLQGGGDVWQGSRAGRRQDAVLHVLGALPRGPQRPAAQDGRRQVPVRQVRPRLRHIPGTGHAPAALRRWCVAVWLVHGQGGRD